MNEDREKRPWTSAQLFDAYFRPLYPDGERDDVSLAAARVTDANPAKNPALVAQLREVAVTFALLAPKALAQRTLAGAQSPPLLLDFSDDSVHRLGAALNRNTRDALLSASAPGDPDAPIVHLVVHGAIYLCACIVERHSGEWGVRRPLWESVVHLESRAGAGAIAPFHWWLKALADVEIDRDGLATRYRQYVERATFRPEDLPPLVTKQLDRKLPTLKVVRYDMLHKYLKANVPEIRDVGRDFPTAEEFQAMGFLEIDFLLLPPVSADAGVAPSSGGRMLLIHGRGKRGLHLLWLDHQGFSHAAFFPASPGDPHSVEVQGDRLVVRFVAGGTAQVHEMLWWG